MRAVGQAASQLIGVAPIDASAASPTRRSGPPMMISVLAHW